MQPFGATSEPLVAQTGTGSMGNVADVTGLPYSTSLNITARPLSPVQAEKNGASSLQPTEDEIFGKITSGAEGKHSYSSLPQPQMNLLPQQPFPSDIRTDAPLTSVEKSGHRKFASIAFRMVPTASRYTADQRHDQRNNQRNYQRPEMQAKPLRSLPLKKVIKLSTLPPSGPSQLLTSTLPLNYNDDWPASNRRSCTIKKQWTKPTTRDDDRKRAAPAEEAAIMQPKSKKKKNGDVQVDESFDVEGILEKKRDERNVWVWFVKWVDHPISENCWIRRNDFGERGKGSLFYEFEQKWKMEQAAAETVLRNSDALQTSAAEAESDQQPTCSVSLDAQTSPENSSGPSSSSALGTLPFTLEQLQPDPPANLYTVEGSIDVASTKASGAIRASARSKYKKEQKEGEAKVDKSFDVECILEKRRDEENGWVWLVKWVGYPSRENCWIKRAEFGERSKGSLFYEFEQKWKSEHPAVKKVSPFKEKLQSRAVATMSERITTESLSTGARISPENASDQSSSSSSVPLNSTSQQQQPNKPTNSFAGDDSVNVVRWPNGGSAAHPQTKPNSQNKSPKGRATNISETLPPLSRSEVRAGGGRQHAPENEHTLYSGIIDSFDVCMKLLERSRSEAAADIDEDAMVDSVSVSAVSEELRIATKAVLRVNVMPRILALSRMEKYLESAGSGQLGSSSVAADNASWSEVQNMPLEFVINLLGQGKNICETLRTPSMPQALQQHLSRSSFMLAQSIITATIQILN